MVHAVIIAKAQIYQQVRLRKIRVHHAQHVELRVVPIVVKYALDVMAVVVATV